MLLKDDLILALSAWLKYKAPETNDIFLNEELALNISFALFEALRSAPSPNGFFNLPGIDLFLPSFPSFSFPSNGFFNLPGNGFSFPSFTCPKSPLRPNLAKFSGFPLKYCNKALLWFSKQFPILFCNSEIFFSSSAISSFSFRVLSSSLICDKILLKGSPNLGSSFKYRPSNLLISSSFRILFFFNNS